MHVLEKYSLSTGLKINPPKVIDEYTPNIFNNYIIIDSSVDNPNDVYPFFEDVAAILRDHLVSNESDIKMLNNYNEQGKEVSNSDISFSLSGKQINYMLKNCKLLITGDNLTLQLAGVQDKRIISLFGSRYAQNGKAFFGSEKNQVIFEPKSTPSFDKPDNSKRIKLIHPEKVAKAACELLDIKYDYPYETIHVGEAYSQESGGLECVPNQIVPAPQDETQGGLIYRMDLLFNENALARQLSTGACIPYTNKRIDLELLATYKRNIPYLVYRVEEDDDPTFVSDLFKMGIRISLLSYLNKEDARKKKLDYMEYGLINLFNPDENFIKKHKNTKNLYYKSVRGLLSDGKIYAHEAAWKSDYSINHRFEPTPVKDVEDIASELDHLHVLKKLD